MSSGGWRTGTLRPRSCPFPGGSQVAPHSPCRGQPSSIATGTTSNCPGCAPAHRSSKATGPVITASEPSALPEMCRRSGRSPCRWPLPRTSAQRQRHRHPARQIARISFDPTSSVLLARLNVAGLVGRSDMAEGTDTWTFPALRALHRLVTKHGSASGCPGFKVLTEVKDALVVEAGGSGFASVTWPLGCFNHSDLPWVRSSAAAPGRRPTMPSSPAESKGQTAMAGIYAPRVLFLGTTYAGHATRFANLRASAMADGRLDPRFRAVTGWRDTGMLEHAPLVPRWLKGRVRAVAEASPFAQFPRPDAIWLSAPEVAAPYTWAQLGPLKRPVVLDLDATPRQLEGMARLYFGRPPKQGLRRVAARVTGRLLEPSVSFYTPWSNWAAEGLRNDGVSSDKIHVI